VASAALLSKPAPAFAAVGVEAAIRAIQTREITYQEFCTRIATAGCVGYLVFVTGRQAVYYGRDGSRHIEPELR
jgi:uncharacterized protein YbcV (DUF1398 family)